VTTVPDHAQVIVIGGGIIGCSTAYHLARDHKAEVLLLERGRLTNGSTWHAAGLVGQLRTSASITRLLKYSVELYSTLEAETGLATGWKQNGGLRLACNRDRWTEILRQATTARSFGLEMHLLTPDEARDLWPLMDPSDLVGAAFLPTDGQASPSDIAQSLARGARMHGARIAEGVAVTGFETAGGRVTAVLTDHGRIACEKVVNCGGMWAKQVGRLAGVSVPLQPVQHQYVLTEPIAGVTPALGLTAGTRDALERVMPGSRSYLHRHEWLKHGTCYTGSPELYFGDSLRLMAELNDSPVRTLLAGSVGRVITGGAIRARFDEAFGAGAGRRVEIVCRRVGARRLIVELRLNLSGQAGSGAGLGGLLAAAPERLPGCGSGIVDRVGIGLADDPS